MDGLWSSPDLAGLLRWAALNRESLALSAGWFRRPAQAAADDRAPVPAEHEAPEPPQHLGSLRPGQRLLPDVPRRDDDLFERGLRVARSVARRRAAQQVPAHGRGRRARPWPARARDRDRLGRLRAVCRGRARLPGDVGHDLPGAVRPCPRACPGGRLGGPRRHPAARLPRHHRDVRRDRLDRDARGRRRRVLRDVLREVRRGARPGRPAEHPVDHVPGRRLRAPAPRGQLDPDVHLPGRPVSVAGRHRALDPRHAAADRAA